MKKFFKVIGIILLIIIVLLLIPELTRKTVILSKGNVWGLNVKESTVSCLLHTSYNYLKINYDYKIEDRILYLRVYEASMLNPFVGMRVREVNINKGYNDFDKIYINGKENGILIWDVNELEQYNYPPV